MTRGRAVAARQAHNLEVVGANPTPAIWQGSSVVEHMLHKHAAVGSIPTPAIVLLRQLADTELRVEKIVQRSRTIFCLAKL